MTTVSTNYRLITLNVPGAQPIEFYVSMPVRGDRSFNQHWRSLNAFKQREMKRAWGKDYSIHKQIVFCEVDDPNTPSKAFSLQRGTVTMQPKELPVIEGLMAMYERIGYDMARQCYLPDKYEQQRLAALR